MQANRLIWPTLFCVGLLTATGSLYAQLLPADAGTTVNGYQDDFDGSALQSGWLVAGANVYSVANGVLHVSTASGDPNHLLYAVAGYDNTTQEVLARIRVTNFGTGDPSRGGLAVGVDPASSQGINLHLRDVTELALTGRHVAFLDDARLWGPGYSISWQNNVWYWMRLRQEPNAASQGGVNDIFAKIWVADGSTAEPSSWQLFTDYTPGRSTRTGYAGITASSIGGISEFDVDYVLIKAAGLPSIVVAPPILGPVSITNQPQSQTVVQCLPATFAVKCNGTTPYTFQWYRGVGPISGATNSSYTLPAVQFSDDGAVFSVVVSNIYNGTAYGATSSNAVLHVSADTTPPVLSGAANNGLNQILVTFSEPVTIASATNVFNYAITNNSGSLPVLSATLAADQTHVTLATSGQIEGVAYTLTVNGIYDQCTMVNVIAANSQATFIAQAYAALDIGNSVPAGSAIGVPGGYNISGGGTDIGGSSDQFQFSYQQRSGDFDLKTRIASLDLSDPWAEAGLVARESLATGSRSAGVLATPTISGCFFQSRSGTNGATTRAGYFPVNYPNTWLRLQRVGNQFTGYAGVDGQSWALLGTVTLAVPTTIYFGLAVSSHNTNQATTAAFRDVTGVSNPTTNNLPLGFEPLGQCSRNTSLVISEIMYHPGNTRGTMNTNSDGFVTNSLEFVELFNALGTPEDISGYRLSGDIDYRFPPGTVLQGGAFVVVARSPADVQSAYGISGVLGPYTNNLPNDTGTVRLRNPADAIFLEINYDSRPPWPVSPDGAGHSLVLARPSLGEDNPAAWAASDAVGGSPGRLEPVALDPLRAVVINEFLAHTDAPELDFIELYNSSGQALDISGCSLSDDPDTNKFVIPPLTVLAPHAFVSFDQNQLGFGLNAEGETIYLRNAANTRVLDCIRYEGQANGISFGRSPDGAPVWRALAAKTPGTNNSAFLSREIVLNEILFHPISGNDDDQFVELYNKGNHAVNLGGWKFIAGLSYTFPSNTIINPDSYLVVARNAARLMTNYNNLGPGNLLGDFGGKLAHGGERIALAMPDLVVKTNSHGVLTTNTAYAVVTEVTYNKGGRWGQWSAGGGSSLELIDPRSDNTLAANWADSDETTKAPWTAFSVTGVLDNGDAAADQLQVLLQGGGECLIDDVEVLNATSVNQIANSSFETDATGWTAEGTEGNSGLETSGGYNSTKSYHVRAVERGDNQVNRVRVPLTAALASGSTATIRAKTRWLRGNREVLFRFRGKWLELLAQMAVPPNPGTPGARNSRAATNAAPAIHDIAHAPVLPAGGQPVVVTARVHDPDGVSAVVLKYRVDPSATYSNVPMLDNGTGGDAVAGDGLYSASIPGQAAGTMVAFYIQATDGASSPATSIFPNNAPARECLVRFGELQPAGNFPVYRIWMTQATLTQWAGRTALRNLDNSPFDVTFVVGNQRVIYNALALYAGSPYIAPGYSSPVVGRCGYTVSLPDDDQFLGNTELVLDWPGGHGGETSAMQEQMGYWIMNKMKLPFCHRYTIRLHVNGVTDDQRSAVFEAVNQPGSDFLRAWNEQTEGDFYKIDRGFEFSDAYALVNDPEPHLDNLITSGGVKKTSKYRWWFYKRAGDSVANYTNIFNLVDAANSARPEPYTTRLESLMDIEECMGAFAADHIIVNFDCWGHEIGKNMYGFKPDKGKWQFYLFDLDWLMIAAQGRLAIYAPDQAALFTPCEDPNLATMFAHPPLRRAFFRAVQDAVNNAFVPATYNAVMDAKYNSLIANGVRFCDGGALQDPTPVKNWFNLRRTYLTTQLASVAANFTVTTNSITTGSNLVTLTGTAPITVNEIQVNGIPWAITWTTITNWTLRLPVSDPINQLTLLGFDKRGNLVAGASNQVTVNFTGQAPPVQGAVVFNEIMYNPLVPNAQFVELLNTSTNFAFDLSSWRANGLSYTFPPGSFIAARSFLVLAKNRSAAGAAYGTNLVVFDEFDGNLQTNGEALTLIKPGPTPEEDVIVNRVRYSNAAPWPAAPNAGYSLQLIDASQDNARVSNWGDGTAWRFASLTGSIGPANALGTNVFILLGAPGDAYIDDVSLVPLSGDFAGTNVVANGDFEAPLSGTWVATPLATSSSVSGAYAHSGSNSLHIVTSGAGSINLNLHIAQPLSLASNTLCTLSFWFKTIAGSNTINVRTFPGTALNITVTNRPLLTTVGANNSVAANLPPYPLLWINEVQPENLTNITDSAGQHDPWIELYNSGPTNIALDGFYLAKDYANLAQWAFPTGTVIHPGEFKVLFADGDTNQTTAFELHTSFRLSPGSGSLALSRTYNGAPQVLDYLNYAALPPGHSYGSFPDGQLFDRQEFYYVTPGGTNNGTSAPLVVFINEWMASNTRTLADFSSGTPRYDDWFELYNPGPNTANLAGYFLTDNLSDQFQYEIPAGYSIPPGGYFLVWADNEASQNSTNSPDLHVNFQLNKAGESIGLFAADGTQIDAVTFGAQTSDVSEGRCPGGGTNIFSMTVPTPRAANSCPGNNTAPVLAAIGNKFVHQGQTLTFTAHATDTDAPPQTLTFSLDPGAPAAASITTAGVFAWATFAVPAPSTNLATIRVRDNGTPNLDDSETISMIVLPPVSFRTVSRIGNQLTLAWDTAPGQTYRVEFNDNLATTNWQPLSADQPGTGMSLSVMINVTGPPARRFYRVRVVE